MVTAVHPIPPVNPPGCRKLPVYTEEYTGILLVRRQRTAREGARMLGEADREQLIRLRWLWEKSYDISADGETWTATRRDDADVVLTASSSQALWLALKDDNAKRKA